MKFGAQDMGNFIFLCGENHPLFRNKWNVTVVPTCSYVKSYFFLKISIPKDEIHNFKTKRTISFDSFSL